MGSIFSHRVPAPSANDYKKYRPYIREDFHECCAYCLMHEAFARGVENFELDHFKPKSKFPELRDTYTNIYYSCHPCNQSKAAIWPNPELESQGFRFIDVCKETFSEHFVDEDGYWKPITNAGRYTEEKIRLNSRHNIHIRRMIKKLLSSLDRPLDWNIPLKAQVLLLLDDYNLDL